MAKRTSIADLLELSAAERILLVEDIWDSIAAVPDSVSLSDAQRRELDSRLAAYRRDRRAGSPWEKVRDRIRRFPYSLRKRRLW
jgi:putative addiction module component (TIGR02574 family)